MGATVHGKDGERMETTLAGQNILKIKHSRTFMEWGRACWRHRKCTLYGERRDKYTMMRLRLTAEAHVWMEAPSIETLIPFQQDRWKQKLLKKAAISDIAFWLEHNRATRQCVQRRGVTNILMSLGTSEELKQANISFLAKILQAKRATIQDGYMGDGTNDPVERNEEPPD